MILDYAIQFSDHVNEVLLFATSMRSNFNSQKLKMKYEGCGESIRPF
jgi:hypothetical protein